MNIKMSSNQLTHLNELEAESIFILREVAAQFEKPCILFSGARIQLFLHILLTKLFTLLRYHSHLYT